jgi:RimJ/RimL family protein N-acetyltransferase
MPGPITLEPATDDDFRWLLGEISATRPVAIAPNLAPADVISIVRGLPANWLILSESEIVGIIGIKTDHGDEVEIGYGIAASREGRGLASAAVGVLQPILRERGVRVVTAETSVDNIASQRALERGGFTRVGDRVDDEDGPLYCWRRAL